VTYYFAASGNPPNAQDNRAESWFELVDGSEIRKGQTAPVHPFVRQQVEFSVTHGQK
jgi:hypothetical protein